MCSIFDKMKRNGLPTVPFRSQMFLILFNTYNTYRVINQGGCRMPAARIPDIQEGKLLKEIDFQIMMCREKIRNHEKSIAKVKKMSGLNGPSGVGAINYSGMPGGGSMHGMAVPDALVAIANDEAHIESEKEHIRALQKRRRNLIRAAQFLDGLEQQVFIHRVLFAMTQESAAETIGVSTRQLQRIERQMKENSNVFSL